ncbi:hypothetical protein [Streptosporangium sp. G12]
MTPALEWRPYTRQGRTSRVRAYVVRGVAEYELCAEGGQMVIRRTVRHGGRRIITEAARGRVCDVEEIWKSIAPAGK